MNSFVNNKYNFSVDWFSSNIPVWTHFLEKYKNKSNIKFLEIGSFQGRSAVWMLENILTEPNSNITCIDTFEGSYEHVNSDEYSQALPTLFDTFKNNVSYFPNQVIIKRNRSQEALKELSISNFKYDFIYIDGDHMSYSALEDGVLSFPLLKLNGIMCFDDYDASNKNNDLDKPQLGITAFLEVYAPKLKILFIGWQVWIEKISE